MPTKAQRTLMNPEYYKDLAMEAIDGLTSKYPHSSRPSVIRAMIHVLTDEVLETALMDRRLHDSFKQMVVEELAYRHPEPDLNLPLPEPAVVRGTE